MSIEYPFETPMPVYFRKNGWFDPKKNPMYMKTLAFVSWCFSRCSTKKRKVFHDHREIELDPYEFIFGRRVCSIETGLTDREIRVQQKHLLDSKILEKATSKTTNKFSVYRWLTGTFLENNDQQKDQEATSRRPADDHNLEDKKIRRKEDKNKESIESNRGEAKVVAHPDFDLIDFFGLRISLSDSIEIRNEFDDRDIKIATEELIKNFYGRNVSSWGKLLKMHISRNRRRFSLKDRTKNCIYIGEIYERCKGLIDGKGRISQSDDKKTAILTDFRTQEEIFINQDPKVFATQLECVLRKFGFWVTDKNEKIVPMQNTKEPYLEARG